MRLFSHPERVVRRISRHAAGNVSRLRAIRLAIASNNFSRLQEWQRPSQPRPLIGREIITQAAALPDNAAAAADLFFAGSEPENKR